VLAAAGFAAASAKERVAETWNRGAATRAVRAATRPANMVTVGVEWRLDLGYGLAELLRCMASMS
jgi:hypothetical protein